MTTAEREAIYRLALKQIEADRRAHEIALEMQRAERAKAA